MQPRQQIEGGGAQNPQQNQSGVVAKQKDSTPKRKGIFALMLGFGSVFGIGGAVFGMLGAFNVGVFGAMGLWGMIPLGVVAVFGIAATIMSIGALWRSNKSWTDLSTRRKRAGRVGKYGLFALMGIVAIVGLGIGIAGLAGASFLASSGIGTAGFIGILLVSAAVFAGVIGANVIFAKSEGKKADAPLQKEKRSNGKGKDPGQNIEQEKPPGNDKPTNNNDKPTNNNDMTQEMIKQMQAQLAQLANDNKKLHDDNQKLMQQLNNQRQNPGFGGYGGGNGFGGGDHYQTKYLAQKIKYEGQLTRQKIDDHLAKETNIFAKYGFTDYMPNNMPPINQRLSPEVLNQLNKQNELQRQLEHTENKIRDNRSSISNYKDLSESGGSSLSVSHSSNSRSKSSFGVSQVSIKKSQASSKARSEMNKTIKSL
jgi:hypothetical protein